MRSRKSDGDRTIRRSVHAGALGVGGSNYFRIATLRGTRSCPQLGPHFFCHFINKNFWLWRWNSAIVALPQHHNFSPPSLSFGFRPLSGYHIHTSLKCLPWNRPFRLPPPLLFPFTPPLGSKGVLPIAVATHWGLSIPLYAHPRNGESMKMEELPRRALRRQQARFPLGTCRKLFSLIDKTLLLNSRRFVGWQFLIFPLDRPCPSPVESRPVDPFAGGNKLPSKMPLGVLLPSPRQMPAGQAPPLLPLHRPICFYNRLVSPA